MWFATGAINRAVGSILILGSVYERAISAVRSEDMFSEMSELEIRVRLLQHGVDRLRDPFLRVVGRHADRDERVSTGHRGVPPRGRLGAIQLAAIHMPKLGRFFVSAQGPKKLPAIASFPAPIDRNPYQALLYRHLAAEGLLAEGAQRLSLGWLRRNRNRVAALHFHWPEGYYRHDRGGPLARSALSWLRLALFESVWPPRASSATAWSGPCIRSIRTKREVGGSTGVLRGSSPGSAPLSSPTTWYRRRSRA